MNTPDRSVASLSNTTSSAGAATKEQGEKTAENIRYGQNISETGMGGITNSTGSAQQGGEEGALRDSTTETHAGRTSQGYGPGNDVGG